jgi:hypothetical protein
MQQAARIAQLLQEQARQEISGWLRTLDIQLQENIVMKTRIADVIKSNISKADLDALEHYQNVFLNKDAVITFMRRDIQQLSEQLNGKNIPSAHIDAIRTDMSKMEHEFSTLKTSFYTYLGLLINPPAP